MALPSIIALFIGTATGVLAWLSETPPNYDEPRVKIMPGFPRDRDLPKPVALVLPPATVVAPLVAWLFFGREEPVANAHNSLFGVYLLEYVGFLLVLAAHLLMRWVQSNAGRFYTFDRSIKSQHKLVTTGPYTLVRHPGYLSFVLTVTGVALFSHFGWLNLLPIATCVIVLLGVPQEERMLAEQFGDEYKQFCKSRSRIVPFVF